MRWVIFAFCLWASPVAAAVTVTSGEHDGFTRLALARQGSLPITVLETPQGYNLTFENQTDFDLGSVFDRIPKTRLTGVSYADGVLSLTIGCTCHLSLFQWQGDWLIIDIKDGADPQRRTEVAPPRPSTLPVLVNAARATDPPFLPVFREPQGELPTGTERPNLQIEQQLAESIARAASQGLLEAADPEHGASPSSDMSPPEMGFEHSLAALADHRNIGISTETVLDRDAPEFSDGSDGASAEPLCLPAPYLEFGTLPEETEFPAAIADARSELTTEFDMIPPGAAEKLAKTYILFGFGAEALQALRLDNVQSKERQILQQFAEIIDGGVPRANDLRSQLGCDSTAAVWAFAAFGDEQSASEIDADLIQRNFGTMPTPLRQVLGQTIAQNLLNMGKPERAKAILDQSHPPEAGPLEPDLLAADLAGHELGPEAKAATLETIAATDARMTPQELITLFALAEEKAEPVATELLTLSQTLRYEFRHDPIASELASAEIRQLTLMDDFHGALELLDEYLPQLPPRERGDLSDKIAAALVQRASDFEFLNLSFSGFPTDISPETENGIAQRLLFLGFPDRAIDMLQSPAVGALAKERRYIRAEAEVQMGNPKTAIEILSGMDDERAAALRTTAMLAIGSEGQEPDSGSLSSLSPLETWRSGQWAALARVDDTLLQQTGDAMRSPRVELGPEPTLAATRAALDRANSTKAIIGQLLDRFTLPTE